MAASCVQLIYHPSQDHVQVFEAATGALVGTLKGHYGEVTSCCYNSTTEVMVHA